jgi:hypothetical protein
MTSEKVGLLTDSWVRHVVKLNSDKNIVELASYQFTADAPEDRNTLGDEVFTARAIEHSGDDAKGDDDEVVGDEDDDDDYEDDVAVDDYDDDGDCDDNDDDGDEDEDTHDDDDDAFHDDYDDDGDYDRDHEYDGEGDDELGLWQVVQHAVFDDGVFIPDETEELAKHGMPIGCKVRFPKAMASPDVWGHCCHRHMVPEMPSSGMPCAVDHVLPSFLSPSSVVAIVVAIVSCCHTRARCYCCQLQLLYSVALCQYV